MTYLSGIAVFLASGILFYAAFRLARKTRFAAALALIIFTGLGLRLYLSLDCYLHPWDERYHALVAKNLIRHPLKPTLYDNPVLPFDYRNWTENHIWVHKQPLPLWSMAAGMALFGVNEIGARIPSILLSGLAVLLTYLIGARLFSRKIGLLAAFLHAIHGMIIELTAGRIATDHIDVFFLFFVELAVFLAVLSAQRKRLILDILTGAAIGLAILCKWLPALVVIALWFILRFEFFDRRLIGRAAVILFAAAVVVLPWQVYIHARYPAEAAWESGFSVRHMTEALDSHSGPWFYHLMVMQRSFGEIIYLPVVWILYRLFRKFSARRRLFLVAWIAIPYLFFAFVRTKMQAYAVFAAPALFLLTAYFFYYLKRTARKWKPGWLPAVVMILAVALPVRYSIDRLRIFRPQERRPEWIAEIKNLKIGLPPGTVIFNHPRPIETMFYTDYVAYGRLPTRDEVEIVKGKGHPLAVLVRGEIPGYILGDRAILLIKETPVIDRSFDR